MWHMASLHPSWDGKVWMNEKVLDEGNKDGEGP